MVMTNSMEDIQGSDGLRTGIGDAEDAVFQFSDEYAPDPDEPIYYVLEPADIQRNQETDIANISSSLSVSKDQACILLLHYKWNVSVALDRWRSDKERVCVDVGFMKPAEGSSMDMDKQACGICFDCHEVNDMNHAGCGHIFCNSCWKGYLKEAVEGNTCLKLRCPSCPAAVGREMFLYLADDKWRDRYLLCFQRSYINDRLKRKWCPSPDCQNAVQIIKGSERHGVYCKCSHYFCWKMQCTEETHVPVSCSIATKWAQSDPEESKIMLWKLKHTKSCPSCKTEIERNEGCLHMTCPPPCNNHFCWRCLQPWVNHANFYECDHYVNLEKQGAYKDLEDSKKEYAKRVHYYDLWNLNRQVRKTILSDLKASENKFQTNTKKLFYDRPFKLISEALREVAQCRQLLGWTYVCGFFTSEFQHRKKEILEYLQDEAEMHLQKLIRCANTELEAILKDPIHRTRIAELATLTRVTRTFFTNLVRYLEDTEASTSGSAGSNLDRDY